MAKKRTTKKRKSSRRKPPKPKSLKGLKGGLRKYWAARGVK